VGRNWVERVDGSTVPLGGADKAELGPGDVFVIETPGGGGYGPVDTEARVTGVGGADVPPEPHGPRSRRPER
jgi:5-oxoprolinase (ATP-hydrolysing)